MTDLNKEALNFSELTKFNKKDDAKKQKQSSQILGNVAYTKYFILENLNQFMDIIKNEKQSGRSVNFFEHTPDNVPINLFFDLDIKKKESLQDWKEHKKVVEEVKIKTRELFDNFTCHFYVLESHETQEGKEKASYHIIVKVYDTLGKHVYLKNISVAAAIANGVYSEFIERKVIDIAVYADRIFRTIYSSKPKENRPLLHCKDFNNEPFNEVESFVTYCPDASSSILLTTDFLNAACPNLCSNHKTKDFHNNTPVVPVTCETQTSTSLNSDKEIWSILDSLAEKRYREYNCWINVGMTLKSLGASFELWDKFSAKSKTNYDAHSVASQWNSFKVKKCATIDDLLKLQRKDKQKSPTTDLSKIQQGENECRELVKKAWHDCVENFEYDSVNQLFYGMASVSMNHFFPPCSCDTSKNCIIHHWIGVDGMWMQRSGCGKLFPCIGKVSIPKTLEFHGLNVIFNVITVKNYSSNGGENYGCNISLDAEIFNDKVVTEIVNQILDGHKICDIGTLMKLKFDRFVFDQETETWYVFNGSVWANDNGSLSFKKNIIELRKVFDEILVYYSEKPPTESIAALTKNAKSLIIKMSNTAIKRDIIEESKLIFDQKDFVKKLNSNRHLLPFDNGVYDLLARNFRPAKKDDFINKTTNYDYDENAKNPEVWNFLEKVLPEPNIRNYVLKKFSDCLNGNLPNTQFLFFIGEGSNGKSQLVNLMVYTMGSFGTKADSTMITRKRPDSNAPSPAKMKLIHKRYAYFSEPEDNEKINISLLKEVTGGESSVEARNLNQPLIEFKMHAKFFLATNELPEVKGEDAALWRRIRVIDFPNSFVDNPVAANEYKIDRDLISRMEVDLSWRQTFANILLDYYYRDDIKEPKEVFARTDEYRVENNQIEQWVLENIEYEANSILGLKEVCERYFKVDPGTIEKGKFRRQVEKILKRFKSDHPGFENSAKKSRGNGSQLCWKHLRLVANHGRNVL